MTHQEEQDAQPGLRLEAVAEAIHATEYGWYSADASASHNRRTWPNESPEMRDVFRVYAQAAIDADPLAAKIRELAERMVAADDPVVYAWGHQILGALLLSGVDAGAP